MFLKDFFLKNFSIKLISVGLALLLWSFVVGQEKAEVSLSVPVAIVNIPDKMVIANDFPANVSVRVFGPKMMLGRLASQTPSKVIDLKNAKTGNVKIEITKDDISLPTGVSISRIQPSVIDIVLEPLVNTKVPVIARTEGEVNDDYRLGEISVQPSEITVNGPETVINKVRELYTRVLNIKGAVSTIIKKVKVDIGDDAIRVEGNDQVEVTVSVVPAKGMERFSNVAVETEPYVDDAQIKPATISVTAAGDKPRLHSIKSDQIKVLVKVAGLKKGKHKLNPEVIMPHGLKLIQIVPQHVFVKLKKSLPEPQHSDNSTKVEQ